VVSFIAVEVRVLAGTLFVESISSRAQGDDRMDSLLFQVVFSYVKLQNTHVCNETNLMHYVSSDYSVTILYIYIYIYIYMTMVRDVRFI
jgi:hypothetical protein